MPFPYTLPFVLGTKAAVLTDDFTTQDTAKWDYFGSATVAGGRLSMAVSAVTAGISTKTANKYDLTGSAASIRLVQRPNIGNNTTQAQFNVGPSNGNLYTFDLEGSNVYFQEYIGSSQQAGTTSVAYDPVAHAYWRIRESGGTIYWDTSPDGVTWTNRRNKTSALDLTSVMVQINTGYYGTEPSPGTAIWDDFNCCPLTSTLTDEFTTQDTAKWIFTNATASGGRAQMPHGASSNVITAVANYDLTSSSWFVECVQVSTNTWVYCYAPFGSDEYAGFRFASGTLHFAEWINDVMDSTSVAYNSTVHRWVRLRESSGTLFWDTSPDSITWTNQRSKTAVNSYTNVRPEVFNDSAATGDVIVDHFNLSVPPASSLTDEFTTLDTAKWTFSSGSTVTGGVLSMTASNFADSTLSDATYDWTGSSLLVKVTPPGTAGVNDYLIVHARIDGSNRMGCTINNSQIFIERFIAGVKVTSSPKTTYNATNHAWIQLRESGGTMFLDVSATGAAGSWTEIGSLSTSTLDLTNNVVFLQAANASGVGTGIFDHLNLSVPPTSSLTDDFTTNTGQWTLSAGATISGGKLNITADTNYNNAYTNAKYDFTGSSVFAEIGSIAGLGLNDETNLALRPVGSDLINGFGVVINNGCVFLIRKVANVGTGSGSFPAYDTTAHRWLRIRESGGIGYLDVSPTGIAGSWTQIDSMAHTMDLTSVAVSAMAGKSSGSATATFDNINTAPAVTASTGQFFVMF